MSTPITAAELAEQVDLLEPGEAQRNRLVAWLHEYSPVFSERSSRESLRLKGYILAAFARLGTPAQAIPFLLEELESGDSAYVAAGAARGLRGWKPQPEWVNPLLQAIRNLAHTDDLVSFDGLRPNYPIENSTSAVSEALHTLEWLGEAAAPHFAELEELLDSPDFRLAAPQRTRLERLVENLRPSAQRIQTTHACCNMPAFSRSIPRGQKLAAIELVAEDQAGRELDLRMLLRGNVTVFAFFYTRCGNPRKCSATITKLAELQRQLTAVPLAKPIQLIAVTYDPGFDLPTRLRAYGQARGFRFGQKAKFIRITQGFEALRSALALCVGYSGSIVNQHAVELFVLDRRARVVADFSRRPWQAADVVAQLRQHVGGWKTARRWLSPGGEAAGVVTTLFVAFLPKCPFCWSVYLSAFGITTLQAGTAWRSVVLISLLAFAMHVAVVFRQCRASHFWAPFVGCLLGVSLLTSSLFVQSLASFRWMGLAMILFSSFLGHWAMLPPRPTSLFTTRLKV